VIENIFLLTILVTRSVIKIYFCHN